MKNGMFVWKARAHAQPDTVHGGGSTLPLEPAGDEPPSRRRTGGDVDLTPREREVLRCLTGGMSYKAVASALDISLDTVRAHVRSVYRKLRVHKVTQAVRRALGEGLLEQR